MLKRLSAIAAILLTAACSGLDNPYRYEGAGLSLYSETQTPEATQNLLRYFNALCAQAQVGTVQVTPDGQQSYACPSQISPPQYTKLMQAGFNDIDLRCDQYLGWIDRKRLEALTRQRGSGALEAFLGAGLTISGAHPDAFAALIAVFGFSREIYSAANSSLLAALETSTIKTLVYNRQKAFRSAASAHTKNGTSRESVVFALRNYILICTPQTIVLDANTFSRDPGAGSQNKIEGDFKERFNALAPTSFSAATPPKRNVNALPKSKLASFDPFGENQIKRIQSAACINVDGDPGPATKQAVALMEFGDLRFDNDPLISASEWDAVQASLRPCDTTQYKNLFENVHLGENLGRPTVNSLVNARKWADDLMDRPLNDPEVRAQIAADRKRLNLAEPDFGISADSDQFTKALYEGLLRGD